ncbi:hypothetical protein C4578_04155, partial [Candidatus Microgenomates bacterium]
MKVGQPVMHTLHHGTYQSKGDGYMFMQRIETVNFHDFMRGQFRKGLSEKSVKAYSIITVSPLAMFDPVVLGVAAGILSIVFLEKFLEGS